jgi:hypothetical protein
VSPSEKKFAAQKLIEMQLANNACASTRMRCLDTDSQILETEDPK